MSDLTSVPGAHSGPFSQIVDSPGQGEARPPLGTGSPWEADMTEKTQFTTVVVPLDGSDFAALALPVAVALANASNAGLRLVGIAHDKGQLAWVQRHVHGAARQVASTSAPEVDVILDPDPARVLLGVAADGSKVLCFASHDYGRVAAKVMHSVGSAIIARRASSRGGRRRPHRSELLGHRRRRRGGRRQRSPAADGHRERLGAPDAGAAQDRDRVRTGPR